jgi:outer membrane lipoprotein-sorting protein
LALRSRRNPAYNESSLSADKEIPMRRALRLTASVALTFLFASPAFAQSVDDIVAKNLAAKGGLDLLRQTNSVKMTGVFKAFQPSETTMAMTTWAKRPNLVRREVTMTPPAGQAPQGAPAGPVKMVQAVDGASAWIQQGTSSPQALPAAQASQVMQDTEFDSVFVDYKTKGLTIDLVGVEKLNGKDVYHLKVTRKVGPPQHYFLDTQTGLEAKVRTEVSQGATQATVETELSDYRDVEGRKVPFKTRQLVNGQLAAEMTIERVEFNVEMPDTIFKMPRPGGAGL